MEAMAAGVPPLVSEWTGGRELVREIHPRLVVPLQASAFVESVEWYLSLEPSRRRDLGSRAREIARAHLTQAGATDLFRGAIRRTLDHFGLEHLMLPDETA
jgi:glycosyltransferase involved in cell wall biosynthesis